MSDYAQLLYHLDINSDGIVTVREFLEALKEVILETEFGFGEQEAESYIEAMIRKCGGEGCDWIQNDYFLAAALSYGLLDYKEGYMEEGYM